MPIQREQLKAHIGDALGEQCTRLLQGMLAVSPHKDMPPGFLLLPFLEPGTAGTGTFAALKGRLRKAKDKLLSKAFKRWAVVFFCQHGGCKDPLGAHPASAFELREPTETLRQLAPYLQALSTLVKVGAAVGHVLQLPLPSRIPFVSDAADAVAGAGSGLLRSELGELYGSVGEELGLLEASASGAAAAAGVAAGAALAAAAAAVAAAGQKEQEAAYQAVKVALDTKRAGKKGSDWRSEHGLRLCTVAKQQLWCCKTCAAEANLETVATAAPGDSGGGGGGGGAAAAAPAAAEAAPPAAAAHGGGTDAAAAATVGVYGMLLKKSSGVLARWQPRFFAIRGHHLEYAETEEEFQQRSRGIINLRGATQCTRSRGLFVTLKAGGGDGALTLELQAESEELAAAWHEELSKFVDARAAASLQSLEQFAPRKGTLVFGRKVSGGGRAPAAAPPPSATNKGGSLLERVAALALSVLGEAGAGGLALQIQALEEAIFGEKQSGALPGRVGALEMEMQQ